MNRRLVPAALAGVAALLLATTTVAQADPVPGAPGTFPSGKAANQLWATVGADAFAELTNNFTVTYNAQSSTQARTLESFDAVEPGTGATPSTINTKPGCSIARPNGANAGLGAIKLNVKSSGNQPGVDPSEYCIDWVRSSRAKNGDDGQLTFYAQSRDAVGYATVGNAYAPTAPLTTAQLKGIFECKIKDWSQVGGQPGAIRVYLPPASAATLTFFLQDALGTNLKNVTDGCGAVGSAGGPIASQQNDGRTLNGDPQGITPYAVTKWAAQSNEPTTASGTTIISDFRGGARIGAINLPTPPTIRESTSTGTFDVLNPAFTTGDSSSFGRLFYNVVRNGAPQGLKEIFATGGYLCAHQEELLVPFGNTPLDRPGSDRTCGEES